MKAISKYTRFIPYLYYLSIIAYWFTYTNRTEGVSAYPILLFGIPFVWQLIRPNRNLNFSLGIIFVCISSYLILAYLLEILNIVNWFGSANSITKSFGILILGSFIMALWMVRNSIQKQF
ncbi:hypothetical protein [Winogradskyella alexanderae]|uniref:Transmembrane family 220 protein n=1 Tax=Winogradskyella alexanderae TaxID=2877123 RepID=A0ABS7XS68_9FLAO|nr:hypothetical protein [Winogradskyella alexanderae]MCA0132867.1 hypothetical protein [Winogradskyella alexanderae]